MRLLGVEDPVLPELLPVSRDLMSRSYPEVAGEWTRVSQNAFAEEDAFRRTLAAGTQIFDLAASSAKQENQSVLSGDRAFQLHDTYGFPIDLTLEMAAEQGLSVDREEFTRLMAEQKARAKADAKAKKGGQLAVEAYRELRNAGETRFLGYTDLAAEAKVVGIVSDGKLVKTAEPGDIVEVVLDQTPFYAESGGQDSDAGQILGNGLVLDVLDVQKPVQGLVVHKVRISDGELVTGGTVTGEVNGIERLGACQAHSATHVVHAILRELLGPTAVQAGSYNKPGYLRFDFNSTVALDDALRQELEGRANSAIKADLEVSATQMPLADAKALGAMAMFGEKYPEIVRMVEMGGPWSRELCGGTHVERSSQIGLLTLLGESSVGSGVRRVEALVSTDAFSHLAAERALVSNLADLLKVQPGQLTDRVGTLVSELKDAHRTIADLKRRELASRIPSLLADARPIGDVSLVCAEVKDADPAQLRDLATEIRDRLGLQTGVVALFGGAPGKPAVVVATTPAARAAGCRAGALVGQAVAELGGRGGGRDDIAQGGGSDSADIPAAMRAVERALTAS
jgi:alanyl-tRNA synthetase